MTYNLNELPNYMNTAGKITVVTALSGVLIFLVVFLFNVGRTEIQSIQAQSTSTAETRLTVLNTPPQWVAGQEGREQFESSTTSPTNSGQNVSWVGTATDSNLAPYFMIVCDSNVPPVPAAAADLASLGTAPPSCAPGAVQWAVSAATVSGQQATAATTTTEALPFTERNDWFAWVCDDDPENPRCNFATSTGISATNTSPFHVNRRPSFTLFSDTSPADPGTIVMFYSTSTDPDVIGGEDALVLHVCNLADFGTGTSTTECGPGGFLASTTLPGPTADASAQFTLPPVIQDQNYTAFGYIVDEHGHAAVGGAQGTDSVLTVRNVAPTVAGASISLNGGLNIILDQEAGETLNFPLEFESYDANSCEAAGGGDEVVGYVLSVFRDGVGTTTCDGSAGSYDPNNCYPSGVGPSVWNLNCTASSTTCGGPLDPTMLWECTFPLWYIADPTDLGSPFESQAWTAAVSAIDDDNATGTYSSSTMPVELLSFTVFDLDTLQIPYGSLEPGQDTETLRASTTIVATGNTGIDQLLSGQSMCPTFSSSVTCNNSGTSTINAREQKYGTTTLGYSSPLAVRLSSTTPTLFEINVPKSTSTTTPADGQTYWGINVPGTIQLAGLYTGENTFQVVVSDASAW